MEYGFFRQEPSLHLVSILYTEKLRIQLLIRIYSLVYHKGRKNNEKEGKLLGWIHVHLLEHFFEFESG